MSREQHWRNAERHFKNDCHLSMDPEFFIRDTKRGEFVSSDLLLPKQEAALGPHAYNLYTDGFQAEFNTIKKTCRHHVRTKMQSLFSDLEGGLIGHHVAGAEEGQFEPVFTPHVELTREQMENLSDFARQFGCDPEQGAWMDGREFEQPYGENHPSRYAGGHIHVGAKDDGAKSILHDEEKVKEIVKVADYILALPMTQLFGSEGNRLRRRAYGKAGAYRDKSYGVEYRVLGPEWAEHIPLMSFVFAQFREAMSIVYNGETEDVLSILNPADVIEAINSADREQAGKLWLEVRPYLLHRNAENHASGAYYRAFDILCAVIDEIEPGRDTWGHWCEREFLPNYPDLLEQHEHGRLYLSKSDFGVTEGVPA